MSYFSSVGVVVVGITIGFFVESLNQIVLWIVASLWGSYTAANILKWYWWRFNGYGYFWGMFAGIITSLILTLLDKLSLIPFLDDFPLANNPSMNSFPVIFLVSVIACFVGTLKTKPESDEVLMKFYRNVKPWGFWKPVLQKVLAVDPKFIPNRNFKRDVFNIFVGITWQITLMVTPVFLVIREYTSLLISVSVMLVASAILKFNWWNKLEASYGDKSSGQTIVSSH